MGQLIKWRKAKVGTYGNGSQKKVTRKNRMRKTKGLNAVGLEDRQFGGCLLSQVEKGGLVSNLKKYSKPDRRMLIKESLPSTKLTAPKSTKKKDEASPLIQSLETQRANFKKKRNDVKMPQLQIKLVSHYLDKYGEDYQAMVTDPMNYDQLTWKQLKAKITAFKNSGAPFAEYLKDRGLLPGCSSSSQ